MVSSRTKAVTSLAPFHSPPPQLLASSRSSQAPLLEAILKPNASRAPISLPTGASWVRFAKFEKTPPRAHTSHPLLHHLLRKNSCPTATVDHQQPATNNQPPRTNNQPPESGILEFRAFERYPEGLNLGCECTNSTFTR